MRGEDIWIYAGHTHAEGENPYLWGEGAFVGDRIYESELISAMNKHAPGVVVIAGCDSVAFQQAFTANGTKIFAGFTRGVHPYTAAEATNTFVQELLNGATVEEARSEANSYLAFKAGMFGNPERTLLDVTASDMTKTMYELLGLKDPNKK